MWLAAQSSGGLTKAGERLGVELLDIIRANALLGYNVPGISAPGYGNLTLRGISEHTQLAQRMAYRMAPLFLDTVGATGIKRQVIVSNSGVNRAVDSAYFFTKSLANTVPGLASLIVNSAPLTAYPASAPIAQAAGTNRFELYFHKLNAKMDLPTSSDPYFPIYQSSLAYQSYLNGDSTMIAKVNSIVYSDASKKMARKVLKTIFTAAFLDALDAGTTSYSNAGTFNFTSTDGLFPVKITGDGQTILANLVDAANSLYAVYSILPAMNQEVNVNMARYFPAGQLVILGYLSDAQDFYQKGPGIAEASPITFQMSQYLLDDFFAEASAIGAGTLTHAAKLRFTHAEIIMPFATRLGLPDASMAISAADTYTYDNNPWRGSLIAPLASNVQWDLYSDGKTVLVKMLYNEKETDFPSNCEAARYMAGTVSHFYTLTGLKSCYGY
ncbi:MAG TPA: hypothetical protein VGL53_31835 [Bryobacteraceae bacterium]|jgi:hypothetical protein